MRPLVTALSVGATIRNFEIVGIYYIMVNSII